LHTQSMLLALQPWYK